MQSYIMPAIFTTWVRRPLTLIFRACIQKYACECVRARVYGLCAFIVCFCLECFTKK